jgi:hypothetical protein
MIMRCTANLCAEPAAGYSTLCELHKRTLRRHGHALQKGVTPHELQPYLERITARRNKNPANPTWDLLRRRWEALTGHAEATLEGYSRGAVAISHERQTAEQLVSLRDTVPADAAIDAALGMFLMWDQRPSRFKSDKAFGFQLSRRIRGLAEVNTGTHWSAKDGRVKRTYRDTPPKVLECLAESLKVAFGLAGLRIAELEKQEAAAPQKERLELTDALKALT